MNVLSTLKDRFRPSLAALALGRPEARPTDGYFSRDSGNTAASGIGTGGPCEACFSLDGAAEAGVAQPQLTAEHDEQPQPQFQ